MKIRIYYNLHRKLFSIQHRTPKGWRLWRHADNVTMHFPTFKVSEHGRQRVLREKRKNVHAFIEGMLSAPMCVDPDDLQRVTYNPYKCGSFVIAETEQPVSNGRYLVGTIDPNTRRPTLLAL